VLQTRKPGSGVQVGASDLVPRGPSARGRKRCKAVPRPSRSRVAPGAQRATKERTGLRPRIHSSRGATFARTSGLGPWSGSVVVLREQPWQEVLEGQRLGRQRYTCAIARPALPRGFCSVLGATARYRRQLRLNTAKRELAGPEDRAARALRRCCSRGRLRPAGSHLAPWRSRLPRVVPAETTRIFHARSR
jgi:hypothetical protein